MSAIDKEKIYEKLRTYHTDSFPEKMKNTELDALKERYVLVEDKIVSMVLSLVNGKLEYVDATESLESFQNSLEKMALSGKDDDNRKLFVSKIEKLNEIMVMAKASDFQLRKTRGKVIQV